MGCTIPDRSARETDSGFRFSLSRTQLSGSLASGLQVSRALATHLGGETPWEESFTLGISATVSPRTT
jgi:hypothetical protein